MVIDSRGHPWPSPHPEPMAGTTTVRTRLGRIPSPFFQRQHHLPGAKQANQCEQADNRQITGKDNGGRPFSLPRPATPRASQSPLPETRPNISHTNHPGWSARRQADRLCSDCGRLDDPIDRRRRPRSLSHSCGLVRLLSSCSVRLADPVGPTNRRLVPQLRRPL